MTQVPTYRTYTETAIPGQVTLSRFAAAFFTFALVADWAYVQTTILMWKQFAEWQLFAGLIAGGFATVLWLVSLALYRRPANWPVVILNALVLAIAFLNSLVHAGDGWTSIVPWGIGMSFVTCVLMLISASLRRREIRQSYRV